MGATSRQKQGEVGLEEGRVGQEQGEAFLYFAFFQIIWKFWKLFYYQKNAALLIVLIKEISLQSTLFKISGVWASQSPSRGRTDGNPCV